MPKDTYRHAIYLDKDVKLKPDCHTIIMRRNPSPIPWYGGKSTHLKWLLPLLPECKHYVEPYSGSAVVLLNRDPSPIETINDINGEVVNFFRILRDRPEELIGAIQLTPFSREEFALARFADDHPDDLERARRFCVLCQQSYGAVGLQATICHWSTSITYSQRHIAQNVAKILSKNEALDYTARRLLNVQIENRPAIEIIKKYDTHDTLFYCDPPYIHATRYMRHHYVDEMGDAEHIELADLLNRVKGKVALSGYENELYDDLYPAPKWRKYMAEERVTAAANNRSKRREILWMNY